MLAVAVLMMLNITADASAPSGESENREFFLVRATGFTATSDNNPKLRIIIGKTVEKHRYHLGRIPEKSRYHYPDRGDLNRI